MSNQSKDENSVKFLKQVELSMWPASLLTVDIRREFKRLLGMEIASLRLIETVIDHLPEARRAEVIAHRDDTLWQIELLQTCTELLDADTMQMPALPARDVAVTGEGVEALRLQNAFEISNYHSALMVARRVPIPEIAEICEDLLNLEKAFSRKLAVWGSPGCHNQAADEKTLTQWTRTAPDVNAMAVLP